MPPPPPPPTECPQYPRPAANPYNAEVIATRGGRACWTLIASGDSVTSAHNQFASGFPTAATPCPNTAAALGRGAGNDPFFSYASGVFNGAGKFAGGKYYNYARTGYSTKTMLVAPPGTTDACGNVWGKPAPPIGMVLNTAAWEKANLRKVSWVTTGGVNNTNWSAMLSNFVQCSFLQSVTSANRLARNGGVVSLTITPTSTAPHTIDGTPNDTLILNLLLSRGGTCSLTWSVGLTSGSMLITVPVFNLPTTGPGITADIAAMVGAAVAARIDKITWVGYYDISPATINVRAALTAWGFNPTLVNWMMPRLGAWGVPTMFPLARNATQTATLHTNQTDLNTAICAGVAFGAFAAPAGTVQCTTWQAPGFAAAADIQSTVIGGMPHPSAAGHAKLKNMLIPRV
jgi:hypothetical protein